MYRILCTAYEIYLCTFFNTSLYLTHDQHENNYKLNDEKYQLNKIENHIKYNLIRIHHLVLIFTLVSFSFFSIVNRVERL